MHKGRWILAFAVLLAGCGNTATSTGDAATTSGDTWTTAGDTAQASADTAQFDAAADATQDATSTVVDAPHALQVDPRIGTGMGIANIGSSFPGPGRPFGLVKASPDTINDAGMGGVSHCGGYQAIDPYITGISHNHLQGTGVPDYGNVAVMPVAEVSPAMMTRTGRKSVYSHDKEHAEPGYYAVTLAGPQVLAEVTATRRCALHRYNFTTRPQHGVLAVDLGAAIANGRATYAGLQYDAASATWRGQLHNHGEFSGRYNGFDVFMVARFDRPPQSHGAWKDGGLLQAADLPKETSLTSSKDPASLGLWAQFDTATNPTVQLQVCLSYVDAAGAQNNLQAEMNTWDFDAVRKDALLEWEDRLAVADVQGGSADERKIFYSSLYRAQLMPNLWSDVDGRYRGFDNQIHTATGWEYYTDLSLWDTFRTQNPLITLLYPKVASDLVRSLQAMADEGGWLPQWAMGRGDTGSMIGQHSASVIADTWLKLQPEGLQGPADIAKLYQVSRQIATEKLPAGSYGGRDCMDDWLSQGWCAKDHETGSVAKTLEYAFNDHCMANLASMLGKLADVQLFAGRAKHYAKLWDPQTQFFRARMSDGQFASDFDPLAWDFANAEYVEGTAWQWLWFVPHDAAGLIALFGSNEAFVSKLKTFFEQGKETFNFYLPGSFYFHGNEPDMLASGLFLAAGRPDLADQWTKWVGDANYTVQADGLVGNDDAGTLSSWYVLAALGLLPQPCAPGYAIVTPRFAKAQLKLQGKNGPTLVTIEAPATELPAGPTPTWHEKPLPARWLDHSELVKGGTLRYP